MNPAARFFRLKIINGLNSKVLIDTLQGSYKLAETVHVTGLAKAYAGNPVDNANVSYRVVRTALFPFWRSWVGHLPLFA